MPRVPARKTGARSQLLELSVQSLKLVNFQIYTSLGEFKSATVRPSRYVICNYPHASLYGTPGRKEGYIVADEESFILEAKYQDNSGSVDEKLPYLWMSFLASPVRGWIAVLDGAYWARNTRAVEGKAWLRRQLVPDDREFYVFNRAEFMTWVQQKWGFDAIDGQQYRRAQHQAQRAARADRQENEQLLWRN
jgi:hypothetical protein